MTNLTLSLCGDVMTGRGIDQILPHPGNPELYETYVESALHYVDLAQARSGTIARPATFAYIWGDALTYFRRTDMRIVNLETCITRNDELWPKGVHYKMHPANIACLSAAGIDCCTLANNHAVDYGYAGLLETIDALAQRGIAVAGAGRDEAQASAPAIQSIAGKGRVIVYAFGSPTSGIPEQWAAGPAKPGLNLLPDFSQASVERIARRIQSVKRAGDVVILSIHWGANFGYEISGEQVEFAHRLIEVAGVDVVHGHSSHHVKAVEIYRHKLILHGCGDFLNDYEGIGGYEEFRDDFVLMYAPIIRFTDGTLVRLSMIPFRIRRFSLHRAERDDASWLCNVLNREGARFNTTFVLTNEQIIEAAP